MEDTKWVLVEFLGIDLWHWMGCLPTFSPFPHLLLLELAGGSVCFLREVEEGFTQILCSSCNTCKSKLCYPMRAKSGHGGHPSGHVSTFTEEYTEAQSSL